MATYYISTSGSNAAAGTSEGTSWLTIDKGMNTVVAGDKVWVKAGTYAELVTIDTVGTNVAPIVFEGYTTTTGDGGQATITGSSARVNCLADSTAATTNLFYVFKNIRFTAATNDNVKTDGNHLTFKKCKFDAAPGGWSSLDARTVICEGCEFLSNSTYAVSLQIGLGIFIGCRFYNNGFGIEATGLQLIVIGCTFFSNGGTNIKGGGTNLPIVVLNCTIDGDAKDSSIGVFAFGAGCIPLIVNNALYDCGVGYESTGNVGERAVSRNNLINANTTAYVNAATFTGEVTTAPQFTNEVGGADYTPAAGSPLINAGFNGPIG